jgi:hypothetical protein
MTALGLAGLVVAVVCLVGVAVHGKSNPPEGKMLDAATFAFGVGVYTLTLALLLPLAGWSDAARRRWRYAFFVFPLYGYVQETVQAFRGLDPRFTDAGSQIDDITGLLFGLAALSNTVVFVLLGLRFFRSDVLQQRPTLRNGIRYGVVAVWASFGVGIIMSVRNGRDINGDGNLLLAHALGVHGIQVLPLVALSLETARAASRSRQLMHLAGIAWITACILALIQAVVGDPPFGVSVLTALIIAALGAWAVVIATAAAQHVGPRREPRTTM